ncbi:MAG: aldehyde dehydrogenase family protein, partial [Deltaproteobacteria bacterium]
VGQAIARANAARPGKLLALELGGKNAAIVCEDANLEQAARDVPYGAFVTAGQRCSATSRCIVHERVLAPFSEALSLLSRSIRVGHFEEPDVFLGPLISKPALDRYLRAVQAAPGEGAEALVAPEVARASRAGHYVRPSVHLVRQRRPESRYQTDELFGPDVALYPVAGDAEALAVANESRFGLCASVFTTRHERFEWFAARLGAGVVNENQPTVGASGRLPFGGVRDSGNQRASGVAASLYCSWPQAVSFGEAGASPGKPIPGFPRL